MIPRVLIAYASKKGSTREVAQAIAFLASDQASFGAEFIDEAELTQCALFRPLRHPCTDAQVFIVGVDASPHPGMDERFGGGPHFDVTSHLSVRREDQTDILLRIEVR